MHALRQLILYSTVLCIGGSATAPYSPSSSYLIIFMYGSWSTEIKSIAWSNRCAYDLCNNNRYCVNKAKVNNKSCFNVRLSILQLCDNICILNFVLHLLYIYVRTYTHTYIHGVCVCVLHTRAQLLCYRVLLSVTLPEWS